jgi:uncharacterized BrkB/YihY/UPF0761 family membrane protein
MTGGDPGDTRARLTRLRDDTVAWGDELRSARSGRPGVDIALRLYERDRAILGNLLAGSVAFRMFLWAVPFALLLVTIVSLITHDPGGEGTGLLSYMGISGELAQSLRDVAREQRPNQAWALVIGLGGALWTSRGLLRSLRVTSAAVWGLGYVRSRVNPLRSALVLMGVVLGLLVLMGFVARLRDAMPVLGLVTTFAMLIVPALLWLGISLHLPRPEEVPVRALLPGAVLVGAGVQGLHLLTVFVLVERADRAQSVYGAFGVAVVLLLWFFLLARVFVSAAVLNAVLWEHERSGKLGLRVLGLRLFGRHPGEVGNAARGPVPPRP